MFEFHKWKDVLLHLDRIISLIVILLIGIYKSELILEITFLTLFLYLIITKRTQFLFHLIIAFFIAFFWMAIAKNQYNYNIPFYSFMGINLFTLFAWTIGLFSAYLIYSHYEHKLHYKGYWHKLGLFIAFYWPLLILVETFFHYVVGITNLAAQHFDPVPICNCMHGPRWVQISYFFLGPIYFTVCYLLGLENAHYKSKL